MSRKNEINLAVGSEFLKEIRYKTRVGSGRLPFDCAVFANSRELNSAEFGKFIRLIRADRIDEAKAFVEDADLFKKLSSLTKRKAAIAGGKAAMSNPKNHVQNKKFTHWSKGTVGLVKAWNKGKTDCENISQSKQGSKNPMFGRPVSDETRTLLSNAVKANILSGKWTPNAFNSRTRKKLLFRGQLFRSSWEALFNQAFPELLYEKLRIPYTTDRPHVYITDFVDHEKKIVYEIKPQKMVEQKVLVLDIIGRWCLDNGYEFRIIDEFDLTELDRKSVV